MKANSQDVDELMVSVVRARNLEFFVMRRLIEGCDNRSVHPIHEGSFSFSFVHVQLVGVT